MGRRARELTAAFVTKAKAGRFGDGDGLYLLVRNAGQRFWVFRYSRDGRMREKGLGPVRLKSLSEARDDCPFSIGACRCQALSDCSNSPVLMSVAGSALLFGIGTEAVP